MPFNVRCLWLWGGIERLLESGGGYSVAVKIDSSVHIIIIDSSSSITIIIIIVSIRPKSVVLITS